MSNTIEVAEQNPNVLKLDEPKVDGTGKLFCPSATNPSRADRSTGVIGLDPWLEPFREPLKHRYAKAESWIKTINESEGGLEKFSRVSGVCRCDSQVEEANGR